MALTKITPQMFDTSAAGHDFNIDNGTFVVDASANRVGIGTATPSTLLHILTASNGASTVGGASDELILENSGDAGLTIRSGSSSDGVISFADADDHNVGQVYYSHSNNTMTFKTNDAIAATINSSGVVTASAGFVGPLTGNVTGNLTGTILTAAQTNITSLGTLTALTVDNIGINGETITLTGGSATGFIQTSTNVMQVGTSTSDPLILYTDNTPALTFDTSQNATFAGDVTINSTTLKVSGDFPQLLFEDTAGSDVDAYIVNNANGLFIGKTNSPSTSNDIVSIDLSTGNSTFSGTVAMASTNERAYQWQRTGVGKEWYLGSDGSGTYFYNATDSVLPIYIKNAGSVGIGTTNPTTGRLHVKGAGTSSSANSIFAENSSGAGLFAIRDNGDAFILGSTGIGVSSPGQTLAVLNAYNYNPPGLGNSSGQFFFGKQDGGGAGSYGLIGGTAGTGNSWLQAQRIDGTATAYNILLQPSGGNVGIGTTTPSQKLHVVGKSYATEGFTTDGIAKSYTWRAVGNSANSGTRYVKICRITASQSARVSIELTGRDTSYGDGSFPAYGHLVGQLNNDNNYDFTYYNYYSGSSQVVNEIAQVDIDASSTDIYIKIGSYAEIAAVGVISAGDIYPTTGNAGASQGLGSAPTGYTAITFQKILLENTSGNVGIGTVSPSAKLDIVGGGSSTGPTLELNSSTSTTFNHAVNAFNSNLTAGENNIFIIGKEGSTKNSGYIGYKWNGAGSNTNLLTFGHWANDNIMNLTADGKLGIGTQSPSVPLHIQTNDSTTNTTVTSLMITNLSTGTTTTGFGGEIRFQAERNNGVNQNTGGIRSVAEVNSGSNISSGMAFDTSTAGVNYEKMRINSGQGIFCKEVSNNGDYSMYIGSICAGGNGNRYAHVQLGTAAGDMYWVEVVGFDYSANSVYGRAGGYVYNFASQTPPYSSVYNGSIVNQFQNTSGYVEIVIDTGSNNTSNRWGSYVLRGGTDTITPSGSLEILQYSYTSTAAKVY